MVIEQGPRRPDIAVAPAAQLQAEVDIIVANRKELLI